MGASRLALASKPREPREPRDGPAPVTRALCSEPLRQEHCTSSRPSQLHGRPLPAPPAGAPAWTLSSWGAESPRTGQAAGTNYPCHDRQPGTLQPSCLIPRRTRPF